MIPLIPSCVIGKPKTAIKGSCFMETIVNTIEKTRFDFMFGFENVYAIFRLFRCDKQRVLSNNSADYEITYFSSHECGNEKDVLKDCLFYSDSGLLELKLNDVIGIRINSYVTFYRFLGLRYKNLEDVGKNFEEIPKFSNREKNMFLRKVHRNGCVLDVLERKLISLSDLDPDKTMYYAIDVESYKSNGWKNHIFIVSDFSLYCIKNSEIKNVTPKNPFLEIRNALYYFLRLKSSADKTTVLVLNKKELTMIRDYYVLNSI